MGPYFPLIIFFLISIAFSFLCSIWEAVLLSITPSWTEQKLKEGGKVGKLLKEFKNNVDRPLSAILTLNTIAHTLGAMGVGAQAEKIWASGSGLEIGGIFIGANAIVGTVMTLAILILSEIIPKTLGANYWKQLTGFTVMSLNFIIKLLFPLVWLSQQITKLLKKDKDRSVFSRADFTAMAELGAKEGVFENNEGSIIQNLLKFNRITAKDVMTPRTVVRMADRNQSIKDYYDSRKELPFSRIPVYSENRDNITGFVLKDAVLEAIIEKKGDDALHTISRNIMVTPETQPLPDLFNLLMEKREHIALVVDEFGGMAGIVSMEDVIETLLGMEIVDELDSIADMQVLARKNWEKSATALGITEEEN
ncbi:MAG: hemolysin family protein [Saprospiraceae bacterium]